MSENIKTTKICCDCKIEKSTDDFYKNKRGWIKSICKLCDNARNKKWRAKNKEKAKELGKKWRTENKEKRRKYNKKYAPEYRKKNREKVNKLARKGHERHKEKNNERARKYHQLNKEKINARKKEYIKNRPDIVKIKNENRRNRINRPVEPNKKITAEKWNKICEIWEYKCAYCGCTPKVLCMDHVIPVSKNGLHSIDNILPCCKSCNSRKAVKLLQDWLKCDIVINDNTLDFPYISKLKSL